VATRGSGVSLAAAAAAGAGGDGALGDAGALRLHQRHTQLPQQGAGAPPRRQGARQHPHAVQKREGHTLASLLFAETFGFMLLASCQRICVIRA